MHVSGDITLGNILTIVALLGASWRAVRSVGKFCVDVLFKIDSVSRSLVDHADTLREHAERMERSEQQQRDRNERTDNKVFDLVSKMQRLIGQMEMIQARVDINHRLDLLREDSH